jgi:hypothetical protein
MKKYMVQIYLPDYLGDDFFNTIPKHKEFVNLLIEKGQIVNYSINLERTKGWIEMNAKSVDEVKNLISRFPIKKYIRYDINEIMIFDGEAYRLPKLVLN